MFTSNVRSIFAAVLSFLYDIAPRFSHLMRDAKAAFDIPPRRESVQILRKWQRVRDPYVEGEQSLLAWLRSTCESTRRAKGQAVRDFGGYEGLIGNTPMVRLESLSKATGCEILVKVSLRCALMLYITS